MKLRIIISLDCFLRLDMLYIDYIVLEGIFLCLIINEIKALMITLVSICCNACMLFVFGFGSYNINLLFLTFSHMKDTLLLNASHPQNHSESSSLLHFQSFEPQFGKRFPMPPSRAHYKNILESSYFVLSQLS